MKKINALILLTILFVFGTINCNAQFKDFTNPYRVIIISPNYQNVYPRFSTLQNGYNAVKDSARAHKNFVVNVTTSYNNISDWTSGYKDSILNLDPYLKLVAFGQAITDSIIGVTTQEFQLLAGILSLNPATAGNGLEFASHQYNVLVGPGSTEDTSLLYIYQDRIRFGYEKPFYVAHDGNDKPTLGLLMQNPFYLQGDTILAFRTGGGGLKMFNGYPVIALSYNGTILDWSNDDTLRFLYNTSQFNDNGQGLQLKLDSGITFGVPNGLKVKPDYSTLRFNSSKQLYVDYSSIPVTDPINNIAGTIGFQYNSLYFGIHTGSMYIKLDSGIALGTNGIQAHVDNSTIGFTSGGLLTLLSSIAGDGLNFIAGVLNIVPNDFLLIENDTLKANTSTVLCWYGDSLTTDLTTQTQPFDSTGFPVYAIGKIKRVSVAYQLSSGQDTVYTLINDISITTKNKLRMLWVNGSSRMQLQTWNITTHAWTSVLNISFTSFANKPWRIAVEMWLRAI